MINCPRCKRTRFNTFQISRYKKRIPIQKCLVCGFLWIEDNDLTELSKEESKKLFIDTLMQLGKERDGTNSN
jgi:hypothetical protein